MALLQSERIERLRERTQECVVNQSAQAVAEIASVAQGDGAAVQAAWSGFVPFLAHPVTAAPAAAGMEFLEAAGVLMGANRPRVL